jgi:hypothetical protein
MVQAQDSKVYASLLMSGEQQELWIKSAMAEEINERIYNKIFCANTNGK